MDPLKDLFKTLDKAHRALRCVDASDTTVPQTRHTLDRVSDAIMDIEMLAFELGFKLSEFRETTDGR